MVRSAEQLIDIWYRTVGGNSTLLLNIPPDQRGRFHQNDINSLREMGEYLRRTFAVNLAEDAIITADKDDGYHTADALTVDSYDEYYKPFDGENTATLTVKLGRICDVTHVVIKEHIPMSQRVESYIVEAQLPDGTWQEVGRETTIGYKKIEHFEPVSTDTIRVRITDSRVCPILSFIGVYG
jgi:alpha-L-fucosidase